MNAGCAGAGLPPRVGTWMSADGEMRHGLRPDDRYVETRGRREPQQQGR